MITFAEAQQIAAEWIPDGHVILPENTEEVELGWYFMHQTKEFVATGNWRHMAVGHGGIVVRRTDGEVLALGSAKPREYWFEAFRFGLHSPCDLTVTSVVDVSHAAALLASIDMQQVIPEEEHGTIWRIPRLYTETDIQEMLQSLPCTFRDQSLISCLHDLKALRESNCIEFELSPSASLADDAF